MVQCRGNEEKGNGCGCQHGRTGVRSSKCTTAESAAPRPCPRLPAVGRRRPGAAAWRRPPRNAPGSGPLHPRRRRRQARPAGRGRRTRPGTKAHSADTHSKGTNSRASARNASMQSKARTAWRQFAFTV